MEWGVFNSWFMRGYPVGRRGLVYNCVGGQCRKIKSYFVSKFFSKYREHYKQILPGQGPIQTYALHKEILFRSQPPHKCVQNNFVTLKELN